LVGGVGGGGGGGGGGLQAEKAVQESRRELDRTGSENSEERERERESCLNFAERAI
jgi:hypothetical protein